MGCRHDEDYLLGERLGTSLCCDCHKKLLLQYSWMVSTSCVTSMTKFGYSSLGTGTCLRVLFACLLHNADARYVRWKRQYCRDKNKRKEKTLNVWILKNKKTRTRTKTKIKTRTKNCETSVNVLQLQIAQTCAHTRTSSESFLTYLGLLVLLLLLLLLSLSLVVVVEVVVVVVVAVVVVVVFSCCSWGCCCCCGCCKTPMGLQYGRDSVQGLCTARQLLKPMPMAAIRWPGAGQMLHICTTN